eukprot:jgi/Bigna1/90600/estExt_fgenesh1_pg.C_740039
MGNKQATFSCFASLLILLRLGKKSSRKSTDIGGTDGKELREKDQDIVDDLSHKTSFTTKEVSDLFKVFKSLAMLTPSKPTVILQSQFKSALEEAGITIENDAYLKGLFAAFDRNETGTIDFREYVLGMSAASRGTAREKIGLSFQVYDEDNTGRIKQEEMVNILCAVADHESRVQGMKSTVDKEAIARFVEKVFVKYDAKKNGVLTFDEYVRAVMNHPDLVEFKSDRRCSRSFLFVRKSDREAPDRCDCMPQQLRTLLGGAKAQGVTTPPSPDRKQSSNTTTNANGASSESSKSHELSYEEWMIIGIKKKYLKIVGRGPKFALRDGTPCDVSRSVSD